MRRCSTCRVEKTLEAFPRRSDRPDGRGTICLACGREYRRGHYLANRAYYVRKARRGRREHADRNYVQLISHLREHPCVDCGETDIRVLQFDHVDPALKTKDISPLLRQGGSWDRVLREIEKCVVRCGNCHRRRTITEHHARSAARNRRIEEQGARGRARHGR